MKKVMALLLGVGLLLASGCMDQTAEVKVMKDGSGELVITQYSTGGGMAAMMGAMGGKKQEKKLDKEAWAQAAESYGEGVSLKEVKEIKNKAGQKGVKATYTIPDITKATLSQNAHQDGNTGVVTMKGKPEEAVKFAFTKGSPAEVVITVPDKKSAQAGKAPQGEIPPQQLAMMKNMLKDMRMRIRVRVDGTISETNATFVNKKKNGVTLLDFHMGKVVKEDENLKKLMALSKKSMKEAAGEANEIDGIKIEPETQVKVSFN
ncbi:MAG: hypothetical protein ACYTGH_12070 [Planctomycetota bacterium]|jgi:hypothetical protein